MSQDKTAAVPRFVVRPMTPSDLKEVLAIAHSVPEAPWWSEAHVAQIVATAQSDSPQIRCGWAAEARGKVCGFLVLQGLHIATTGARVLECEVESIAVHAEFRRSGIGRALLGAAVDWGTMHAAAVIRLEVRSHNLAALAMYQQAGFGVVGKRAHYYHSPADDAVLMELPLPPGPAY